MHRLYHLYPCKRVCRFIRGVSMRAFSKRQTPSAGTSADPDKRAIFRFRGSIVTLFLNILTVHRTVMSTERYQNR
jgi:hypothetical protein